MKILALDSSGMAASVALIKDEVLQAEYTINYKKTHSQTLLPMLDEIVRMTESDLEEIDAIAVAAGPGSFTGLRIGSATAKGLGLALKKPLIAVPTLEGLAYNMYGFPGILCPMMDARRQQVYTGLYSFSKDEFYTEKEQCVISVEECIARVNELKKSVIFLGDAVLVYKDKIKQLCTVDYAFAPAHKNQQSAASVAARAIVLLKQGKIVDADAFAPEYLRLSQAEREREQRLAKESNNG